MAAVQVHDLVVRYDDLVAVDHLSFNAAAGAVTAVLGPNGAGKTSTIEVLEGFRRPAGGEVRVLGLDPVGEHHALVSRMGVMLQQGGIYPGIRAGEAAALFCAHYGHRRTASEVLDEPTASVDVAGRQRVRAIIRALGDAGCCVVLTTHELEEAERLADRVVIIDRGHLVAEGTPGELTRSIRVDEIRFGAPRGLDVAGLGATIGALVTEESPGEYVVDGPPDPTTIADLTAWLAEHDLPLADLRAGRKRLEDVYLALTNRGEAQPSAPEPPESRTRRRGRS